MTSSHMYASQARVKELLRQAKYNNRRVKNKQTLKPVVEPAGYDIYLAEREDDDEHERFIAHSSFLVSYYYPTSFLKATTLEIEAKFQEDGTIEHEPDGSTVRTALEPTTAPVHAANA
ncbi:hypothetical protein C6341_g18941 [Phytophthora cactorum]|nr:hypothetical protein C6341_g18941 [Phytophthora cactorum]